MSSITHRIRPELQFSPARSGRGVYYIVEDSLKHRFWKIGLLEYEICTLLDGKRSIQSVASILANRSKLGVRAGVEQIVATGMWLLRIGIVESLGTDPTADHGEPPKPEAAKAKPSRMFDPSFFRIPVFSPESVDRYARGLTWLISVPCMVIAAILWLVAGLMAFQNREELALLGRKLFVPGSQWWLLIAWFVLKAVHEAGHAIANTSVGAKSNGAGIGMMFFAPSPFVDVTSLWTVPNRWSRMLVSAAGMLFEITLAALAVICACTIESSSIKFLCFTIASLGTFTTIAFNGNPLMRYDGYYILVDWIDRPNLWQDASHSMKAYFSTWFSKVHSSHSWSTTLLIYGICCWVSRILMLITMGWGIWLTWDGVGLAVVAFFAVLWFLVPQISRFKVASDSLRSLSLRDLLTWVSPFKAARCLGVVSMVTLSAFLPSPIQIYWPAIVEYVDPSEVRTSVAGFVAEVLVHDGQGVQAGDEILRLKNPDLELECLAAQSQLKASEEKCVVLRAQRKHSELQAEEALKESFSVTANILLAKVSALHLKSPRDGVLIARMSRNLLGSFVPEGQSIGMVVDPTEIEINASIPQYAWETVAHQVDSPVSIAMSNGDHWTGKIRKTLPRTSDVLESPSLAGLYGGPITVVQSTSPNGEPQLKTESPRLQTRIELNKSAPKSSLLSMAKFHAPPPPGAHCSIKLEMHTEAIWETGYRWIKAGLQTQFAQAQ